MEYLQKILDMSVAWLGEYSLKVLAAILILIVGRWLAGKLAHLLARVMEKNNIEKTLVGFLEDIAFYTLMVLVLIAAAGQLGINTTSFLTIVGAAAWPLVWPSRIPCRILHPGSCWLSFVRSR